MAVKNQSGVEVITALICDVVRKEITGQDIIIGVYSDEISVAQLPLSLVLTLYLRIRFKKTESTKFDFRVMGESGIQITPDLNFEIPPPVTGHIMTVAMGPIPINIQALGKITFDLKFTDANWESATDIRFVKPANADLAKVNQPTVRPTA